MEYHKKAMYPFQEHKYIDALNKLFIEWSQAAAEAYKPAELGKEDFNQAVTDGFYPFYTDQKVKILFIGRESLDIKGKNYMEVLMKCYKEGIVGDKHLNSAFFHNRMFYIAYALNKDIFEWNKIPFASVLKDQFAVQDGFSFAFMNLSKFSNESGSWQAEWNLIDRFVTDYACINNTNYINKQIGIINPDLIITMNLGENLKWLGDYTPQSKSAEVNAYQLKAGDKEIQLFDAFHFSAPNKSSKKDYFDPIIGLYRSLK